MSELQHYGVKGMKWGVRKRRDDDAGGPSDVQIKVNGSAPIQVSGGRGQAPSADAVRAAAARQKARASGPQALSNEELQAVVTRMNLEQNYSRLTYQPGKVEKGQAVVKEILGVGKTINEVMQFANSPVAQELKSQLGMIDAEADKKKK